jgi:raffinose/stachyose/melibiose transport system permease protein
MSAFVFSRNPSKLNKFIYFFIILGISLPINYVALMKILQISMLNNTRLGIILLYTAVNIPISIFIMHSFVSTIPKEIDEAAIIDGCSPLKIFFYVIFPLFKPVVVTVGVLCFMSCWNEFIYPLYYLNSSFKWPMSLAVYNFFGQYVREWNIVCADIVLTSLPVIIVYILGQKYIVSGMTVGSVKG